MAIVIVDYGSGNLHSAAKAFERAVREAGRSDRVLVTDDPEAVRKADRIVLPGVGAFGDCRQGLEARAGVPEAIRARVVEDGYPFLGICVGMQLMATEGLEHGRHEGFDWIPGTVKAIEPSDPALKVPHMGWNELQFAAGARHPVLAGLDDGDHAYFVHSYHLVPKEPAHRLATVDYGGPVTAVVGRDNLIGTQFHPEKSQAVGLKLITNFVEWRP